MCMIIGFVSAIDIFYYNTLRIGLSPIHITFVIQRTCNQHKEILQQIYLPSSSLIIFFLFFFQLIWLRVSLPQRTGLSLTCHVQSILLFHTSLIIPPLIPSTFKEFVISISKSLEKLSRSVNCYTSYSQLILKEVRKVVNFFIISYVRSLLEHD